MNASTAADDWFDMTSKKDDEFPDGNRNLNWKDKGFGVIFDLLTVFD